MPASTGEANLRSVEVFQSAAGKGLVRLNEVTGRFTDKCFDIPNIITFEWRQVLVADIRIGDHGRRLELVLGSADHTVFDALHLEMPVDPKSVALLQCVQKQIPRLGSVPQLLLRRPIRNLYSHHITFKQVFHFYYTVSNVLEALYGIMFFVMMQRSLGSSSSGVLASLVQLRDDVWQLAHHHHTVAPEAGRELLELVGRNENFLIAAFRKVVGHQFAAIVAMSFLPMSFVFQLGWLMVDFCSDFLIVLLLAPHILMLWFFVERLVSTMGRAVGLVLKATATIQRLIAHVSANRGQRKEEKSE